MRSAFVAAAGVVVACHAAGTASAQSSPPAARITPAPAFTAEELVALPRSNWITNGGNIFNQRYSPLTLLNRDNVHELKALWRTSMGSGANPNNSGQAQILVYEGVLYVVNGANDVFAMDVDTGEILWTYHGNPDPRAGVPMGKSSRGVAMGDGKIFLAQLDARLVALDQRTGEVVWSIAAERWQDGFSITSAPLYYDGMVITGFSGGELASRGRVKAFDADDGSLIWTFYTVPGPGEFGHDTWPQDNDAWKYGGAPVWQTPAVDPELGMIYFSTGNPGPDLHGGVRPGDNLFSVSIVALDVHTGEYRWHFQQVHHDIWDYDSPNPVILFDAEIDGRLRKGLVQVSKTGWAYILDRTNGEPLIGIEERPVPQEPRQATSPTQPYPIGDAIVPQYIDIPPEGSSILPDGADVVNGGRIFTPFWTEPIALKPGTMGGANWPPSSYDPETHLLYVCATDRINAFSVDENLKPPTPNEVYMGGRFVQAQADDRGILAALDVRTNKLVWRQQWREICYSGSVVTAGGLLFVGRNDGRLTALDKRNGRLLWEFMTDAGVNTTVTTFEHNGDQRVVVHAGGGVFAGSKRGDGIWMFSLKGTMKSLPLGGQGPAGRRPPEEDRPADVERGRQIYAEACIACHGEAGDGGHGGGPTLVAGLPPETIAEVARAGRETMPAFGTVYSAAELRDVAAYVVEVLAKDR
ncbi:MAG TPA: PQQ-binding-like beta-propeller repeat protein [Gammaproteobacteria bacterium]